ncbi:MarR family winged helix-turn-helix transcriptional regulator [Sulfitobacter donghicola]|uniref:MarR family transcriptional regulator n=1 Tax=Sulfitobacter donghicola DSW-25 = KCTC 12864 = JCM 14565 TaxID=1300350 RepID=A0A073IIA0_9RHOB|nr:MarR family winged helix-turn-helix transcriptional regulator [Sulfitobacter donghicola]KEJ89300.1 MarR family transcriptional regulator [Sulfitobacter donghicola DSW-25 = KCTC 12864 = JCM 14565]KIN69103.1 Transcriptional regulatory protein [Sulfitobacter donghicola DSW-25 = KCTC 12864 = JCM 14565]
MTRKFKVFHQLQIAYSAVFRAADHRCRAEIGLSTSQLGVLFVLSRKDGRPISEISQALSMGKSSITGLVDRMCEKGLVRRSPSPLDGRVTHIYLEPLGHAALNKGKQLTSRFNDAVLAPFSAQEQDIIERFLFHLADDAEGIIAANNNMEGENADG